MAAREYQCDLVGVRKQIESLVTSADQTSEGEIRVLFLETQSAGFLVDGFLRSISNLQVLLPSKAEEKLELLLKLRQDYNQYKMLIHYFMQSFVSDDIAHLVLLYTKPAFPLGLRFVNWVERTYLSEQWLCESSLLHAIDTVVVTLKDPLCYLGLDDFLLHCGNSLGWTKATQPKTIYLVDLKNDCLQKVEFSIEKAQLRQQKLIYKREAREKRDQLKTEIRERIRKNRKYFESQRILYPEMSAIFDEALGGLEINSKIFRECK